MLILLIFMAQRKSRFTVMQKIKFLMSREITLFIELRDLVVVENTSEKQKDVSFLV